MNHLQDKTEKPRKKKHLTSLLITLVLVAIILCYATEAYLRHYYHALDTAVAATASDETVTVTNPDGDTYYFIPSDIKAGLIFYSGGKVEYTAYAPLMHKLAENGILCILPHLTGNLAILDGNAADGYMEEYPEVENWYVGGHSLGGVAASRYADKHSDSLSGLILLASYSTRDLSDSGLNVISVYGSEDCILDMDQYEKARQNLPPDFREYVIDGGIHAYFGNYGEQKGDKTPSISREEQQDTTVDYILYSMNPEE